MKNALILVDKGKVGTRKQAEALCQALGVSFSIWEVSTSWSVFFYWASQVWKVLSEKKYEGEFYDLIISAGRRSVPLALCLKRFYPQARSLHIMNPGRFLGRFFDFVITPEHDGVQGRNVLQTCGALVYPEDPTPEAERIFAPLIQAHKKTIAFIIGGPTKAYTFSHEALEGLIKNAQKVLEQEPMNVLITFSRRTDKNTKKRITEWGEKQGAFIWSGHSINPYTFFLKKADCFVVTQDSISMICDACYTGKPVYVAQLKGFHKRFDRFFQILLTRSCIRWFEGVYASWAYEPLREVQRIAALLKR